MKVYLEQDCVSPNCASVHYMSPKEIQTKNNPDVLHDEDNKIADADKPATAAPQEMPVVTNPDIKDPITAIDTAKSFADSNPANVPVTKFQDKYYVSYADLKNYMNNAEISNFGKACNTIIKANPNAPDLGADTLKVAVTSEEYSECTDNEKAQMESAEVDFQIF